MSSTPATQATSSKRARSPESTDAGEVDLIVTTSASEPLATAEPSAGPRRKRRKRRRNRRRRAPPPVEQHEQEGPEPEPEPEQQQQEGDAIDEQLREPVPGNYSVEDGVSPIRRMPDVDIPRLRPANLWTNHLIEYRVSATFEQFKHAILAYYHEEATGEEALREISGRHFVEPYLFLRADLFGVEGDEGANPTIKILHFPGVLIMGGDVLYLFCEETMYGSWFFSKVPVQSLLNYMQRERLGDDGLSVDRIYMEGEPKRDYWRGELMEWVDSYLLEMELDM